MINLLSLYNILCAHGNIWHNKSHDESIKNSGIVNSSTSPGTHLEKYPNSLHMAHTLSYEIFMNACLKKHDGRSGGKERKKIKKLHKIILIHHWIVCLHIFTKWKFNFKNQKKFFSKCHNLKISSFTENYSNVKEKVFHSIWF